MKTGIKTEFTIYCENWLYDTLDEDRKKWIIVAEHVHRGSKQLTN